MKIDSFEEMHDVEARLRSLYDAPVPFDMDAVMAGAARRARHRRRARTVSAAGGALVAVGVIAAAALAATFDTGHPRPAGGPASATRRAEPIQGARLAKPLYGMPDVAPRGPQLVGGVRFFSDTGDGPGAAPALGAQSCQEPGRTGLQQVASRNWSFSKDDNHLDRREVDLTLTGWPHGRGSAAMRELVGDTGECAFLHRQTPLAWPGHASPDHWLAVSGVSGDDRQALAVTRVGDVLVTVVSTAPNEKVAVQMATGMNDAAVARLRESGLPAAAGSACSASTPCPPASAKARDARTNGPKALVNAWVVPDVHPTDPVVIGPLPAPGSDPAVVDDTQSAAIPPVMGPQSCQDSRRPGGFPDAGRSWDYGNSMLTPPGGSDATLTVTGWSEGTGPRAMADIVHDTGFCQFVRPMRTQAWAGHPGADHWLATWTDTAATKRVTAVAVTRLGDVLVATSVTSPDRRTAVRLATSMTDDAAGRVRASGIPAAQGR
ncbi:MAG: hypothetical protein ACXVYS_01365 [Oryzihumus sp.]